MESNMVNDLFDNSETGVTTIEAISLVKSFFENNLPLYKLTEEYSHPPYWKVKYFKNEIIVIIEGDMGFSGNIIIDGKDFPLWQFDRNVTKATKTNKKNVLFILGTIKRFFESQ